MLLLQNYYLTFIYTRKKLKRDVRSHWQSHIGGPNSEESFRAAPTFKTKSTYEQNYSEKPRRVVQLQFQNAFQKPITQSTFQNTPFSNEQRHSHQQRINLPFENGFKRPRIPSTFEKAPFSFRTENIEVLPTNNFRSFFSNQVSNFKQEVGFPLSQIHPPNVISKISAFSTNTNIRDSESNNNF